MIDLTVDDQASIELFVNERLVQITGKLIATDDGQGNVTLSNVAAYGDENVTLS